MNARFACTGAGAVWSAAALTLAVYWYFFLCARATVWGVGIRCLLSLCFGGWVFVGGLWVVPVGFGAAELSCTSEPVSIGASCIELHQGAIWAQDKN